MNRRGHGAYVEEEERVEPDAGEDTDRGVDHEARGEAGHRDGERQRQQLAVFRMRAEPVVDEHLLVAA